MALLVNTLLNPAFPPATLAHSTRVVAMCMRLTLHTGSVKFEPAGASPKYRYVPSLYTGPSAGVAPHSARSARLTTVPSSFNARPVIAALSRSNFD